MKRAASAAALLLFAWAPALAQEDRDPALEASLHESCKARYDYYLLSPYPRAFALSANKGRCTAVAGGTSQERVESDALATCGNGCSIVARSPALKSDEELTPAEMRPAQRDPTSRYLGPSAAVGAVIWSPGSTPNAQPSRNSTAAFVRSFNEARWDIWRVDRLGPGENTINGAIKVLNEATTKVKGAGYRKIVLAGQSAGGFISLYLAGRRTDVDAAIATAPAIRGDLHDKGPQELQRALREFDALFAKRDNPAARVAVALFEKDEYDPSANQRTTILQRRARENGWPVLLIDQPDGLTGHHAGRGVPFALRYRECLIRFVDLPALGGGVHDCPAIMRTPR